MSRAVVTPLRRPARSVPTRRPARARKTVALGKAKAPDALAARVFLLAYDPMKGRLTNTSKLGKLLRAAALVDLQLAGNLADDNGRARLTKLAVPDDQVLAGILADIGSRGPRKWKTWVDRRQRAIVREVRSDLERAYLIRVESYRVLGLFPAHRITLRHPLIRRQVLQSATDTLRPSRLVTRVDLRDAAVVVLAATADLRTVVTKDQRNRHKDRLAQLGVRVGPVVPALKKSLQQSSYAAAG
ncbi:GPP34 family phosphoprotein [Kribbella capetownensis]|uniref:GPP34 family phosphoprotein n=1 Tax=Kribbella capetownensis TaxID=1572659 RepID=A0A4R0J6R0_9ACTN|nr:GPP34 family phosphoprotein [Kribbella capetownensis]TCC40076.1 GPP34 family phosphoprotein [Kribbella capetownensis]